MSDTKEKMQAVCNTASTIDVTEWADRQTRFEKGRNPLQASIFVRSSVLKDRSHITVLVDWA